MKIHSRKTRYSVVPEWWTADLSISEGAFRLLCLISLYANQENGAIVSRQTFMDILQRSPAQITRYLRELVDAEALEIIKRFNDHGYQISNGYRVIDTVPKRLGGERYVSPRNKRRVAH